MNKERLNALVETALERITQLYKETDGKCVLSFSGGKDSTVVAYLYIMAMQRGLVGDIEFVFSNTGVEFDGVVEFVHWFNENVHQVTIIKPSKPLGQILKEYGVPAVSKSKSSGIKTIQNFYKKGIDPSERAIGLEMLYGFWVQRGKKIRMDDNGLAKTSMRRLSKQHLNLAHPDHEYKISDKCCKYLKKDAFDDYYVANNIKGYFTGIRKEEGGIRSIAYTSCTSTKKIYNYGELKTVMPIFYWKEEDLEHFILKYNVQLSKVYTEYGLDRTGCVGCPFAKDIVQNLRILKKHEQKKYKAVMSWYSDAYIDMGIEFPEDEEYHKRYLERLPIIKERRREMVTKYRDKERMQKIAKKVNEEKKEL